MHACGLNHALFVQGVHIELSGPSCLAAARHFLHSAAADMLSSALRLLLQQVPGLPSSVCVMLKEVFARCLVHKNKIDPYMSVLQEVHCSCMACVVVHDQCIFLIRAYYCLCGAAHFVVRGMDLIWWRRSAFRAALVA
jgi:hypothetical protein